MMLASRLCFIAIVLHAEIAVATARDLSSSKVEDDADLAQVSDPSGGNSSNSSPPVSGLGTGAAPENRRWSISIGVTPVFGSTWLGADDTALSIFPDLRVNYGDTIFLSVPDGLGWNAVNQGGWKVGPLIKLQFGRDERNGGSPFLVAGGSTALRGMGDIGVAGEAGVFAEKSFGTYGRFKMRTEVRQGFGAHDALVGDVSAAYQGAAGRAFYSIGPRATLATKDYMQTYFGVTPAQAMRTGLRVSRLDGGLVSYGLSGSLIRPLNESTTIALFGSIDRLGGEPAGSALIRERGSREQFTLGINFGYRFSL